MCSELLFRNLSLKLDLGSMDASFQHFYKYVALVIDYLVC